MARNPSGDPPVLDPGRIAHREFGSGFRGFDADEVRVYLVALAELVRESLAHTHQLEQRVAAADHADQPGTEVDEARMMQVLGEETTRVLESARQAAAEIRAKAEDNVARMVREAADEAGTTRRAADEHAGQARSEADADARATRADAETYATELRRRTDEELAAQRAGAETEATQVRSEADAAAQALRSDAEAEATRTRTEADAVLQVRRAEADEVAAAITARAEEGLAEATRDAEALVEAARQEGKRMIGEAQRVRERVLKDFARRRKVSRHQLEQLRAARERLLETYAVVRRTVDDATQELTDALPHARAAAEDAGRRVDAEPEPTVAELEVELGVGHGVEPEAAIDPGVLDAPMALDDPVVVSEETDPSEVDPGEADPSEAVPEGPDVDALFARLRAAREGDESPEPPVAHGNGVNGRTGPEAEAPAAEAPVADPSVASVAAPPDEPTSLLERRDAATDEVEHRLARLLKRVMADEQSRVLDAVRRSKGTPTFADVVADADVHVATYADAAVGELEAAAATGAGFDGDVDPAIPDIGDLAAALATELAGQLRPRIERCFDDAATDEEELTNRIRACYREWKTQRLQDAIRHFVLAAFNRGVFEAVPAGTCLQWVVDNGGVPCPDAEDNALAGPTEKGEPFPTGHPYPPAHAGCRCLVVPVMVDSRPSS